MAETLQIGPWTVGGIVADWWVAVSRAIKPATQPGVTRAAPLLTDNSPNVFYELHVVMKSMGLDHYALQKSICNFGDVIMAGKQTVVVTDGSKRLEMEDCILQDPIQTNRDQSRNPAKLQTELVFVSVKRPR